MALIAGDMLELAKLVYLDGVTSQIYTLTPALAAFKDAVRGTDVKIGGRGLEWALQTALSGGSGFVAEDGQDIDGRAATTAEGGNLFPARIALGARPTTRAKELYGRIRLTNREIQEAGDTETAFTDIMGYKMESMTTELARDANGHLFGWKPRIQGSTTTALANALFLNDADGAAAVGTGGVNTRFPTGVLAQSNGAAAALVHTFDNFGSPQMFWPQRRIAFATQAELQNGATATMSFGVVNSVTINAAGTVVTVNTVGNMTSANDDFVTTGDTLAAAAAAGEPMEFGQAIIGLDHISRFMLSDSLHGIDGNANAGWVSTPQNVTGGLQQATMNTWLRNYRVATGRSPSVIAAHPAAVDQAAATLFADVRYEQTNLVGGLTGGYNIDLFHWQSGSVKVPMLPDPFCMPDAMYTWHWDWLKIAYGMKWQWVESPGQGALRVANRTSWEMVYGSILEMIPLRRGGVRQMQGFTVDWAGLEFAR